MFGTVFEPVLMIAPLVLGLGRRLFDGELPREEWKLTDCRTSGAGVAVLTDARASEVGGGK